MLSEVSFVVQSLCARCQHGTGKNHRCLRLKGKCHESVIHWHRCKNFLKLEVPEGMAKDHASTNPPTSLFSLAQTVVEKRDVQK